jgi:hypothetical protein
MFSVIVMMTSIPASADSRIASAAKRGGTKTIDVLAPVAATASATVSKIGTPSTSSPDFPGVTPATRSVP